MTFRSLTVATLSLWTLMITAPLHASDKDGWENLFDGKTLNGWKQAEHGKAKYEVVEGTILGTTTEGSPNSFLASEREYGDFELEFEVKVQEGLNSGVQIRSRGKTKTDAGPNGEGLGVFHGPQVEIDAKSGQAGFIYGESTKYGWLSPEPNAKPEGHKFFKSGEWNQYRIIAKGPRIQTFINGNPVADLTHEEIFKTHPKGHIGLQVHGIAKGTGPFQVSWRNIRVRQM